MKLKAFIALLYFSSILACSPGQNPNDNGGLNPEPNGLQQTPQQGGTDSVGGGNGLKGRLLESYIVRDMTEKPYYKNHLQNIITKISKEYPEFAYMMVHIQRERDWYFVPAPLDQISQLNLGTYASTDQYALQDLNKVWINSKLFDSMESEEEQARLILHELIMGVRLMQFQTKQDLCIAMATNHLFDPDVTVTAENREKNYSHKKRLCREAYPVLDLNFNADFKLNDNDYDFIRKIVSKLIEPEPDFGDLKSLVEARGFLPQLN